MRKLRPNKSRQLPRVCVPRLQKAYDRGLCAEQTGRPRLLSQGAMLCPHLWEPLCPCSRVGTGSVSQVHGHQAEKVLDVLKHTVDVLLLKSGLL